MYSTCIFLNTSFLSHTYDIYLFMFDMYSFILIILFSTWPYISASFSKRLDTSTEIISLGYREIIELKCPPTYRDV